MQLHRTAIALAMSIGGTLGLSALAAAPANAVQPVIQACVGTTFSGNATNSPPGSIGQGISAFAQSRLDTAPGLGDGIHDLQLGNLSDSLVPNTCNG